MSPLRILALLPVLAGIALTGACSSDVNPLREAYVQSGAGGPRDAKAADFVANSRRTGSDFMPVGVSAPQRAIRAKSNEGAKALEADLEGARSRNEARGRAAESAGRATPPARATQ